ncbi:hypothetical protein GGI20_000722 [Coemansia sp. BCRC 34301]|nr:hypothetical protein GGI20_000722 [Coemansia sp. BCRC 34301]
MDGAYSILVRQGYAAQDRRKKSSRRTVHAPNTTTIKDSEVYTSADEHQCSFSTGICQSHLGIAAGDSVPPIDVPFCAEQHAMFIDSVYAGSSSYSSSSDASTPATPSSPQFRSMLHELYSNQLQTMAIREEDGEDGTIIHNGLKRLSMSEAKLVLVGRPRILNM